MVGSIKKFFSTSLLLLCPLLLAAHGVSLADQEILNDGGLLAYIYVGAKHMCNRKINLHSFR